MILYKGFEMGCVFNTGPNKLLILGGKKNYCKENTSFEYDMLNKTVINKMPIRNAGRLAKYGNDGNIAMILGEDKIINGGI